jgi:C1A family cysteine protease
MFRKTALILFALLILLTLLGGTLAAGSAPPAVVAPTPMPVGQGSILIEAPALPTQPETGENPPHGRGFIPPPMDLSHLTGQSILRAGASIQALPAVWDWHQKGKVTPVKDQSTCGSCYAFAALGNFEAKLKYDGVGEYDFSENNAKECNWRELNVGSWNSCAGGNYYMMANLFSKKGTVLEADDPYVASDVSCNSAVTYQYTLLDWRIISGNSVPDTDALKQYIYNNGTVYTALYASFPGFSSYDGSYTLYYAGTETPDHAVLIVGWDDTLTHAGGTGGWIVKNSYGTGWGDNGYFTIAYGSASIGTSSSFMHDWQVYDSNGDLWYYDEDGMNNAYGCSNTTAWGLAKFTADSDTYVTRVELWTWDVNTDVDVYLYDSFDGSNLGALLAQNEDKSFAESGYHSIALDSPVAVSNGSDVVAVVKVTNDSFLFPIPLDSIGPSETGRTYVSCNGNSWADAGSTYSGDVGIRLRTSSDVAPQAWWQSSYSGFDNDPQNEIVTALAPFDGELWAGTYNSLSGNGFQLWRLNSSGEWYPEWQGDSTYSNTVAIDHMIVFSDTLFFGTWNEVEGGEMLSFDGTDYYQVNDPGFGDPTNGEVFRLAVFDDTLYAGTCSFTSTHGAEIWRSSTGTISDWTRVVSNGFGDADNWCVVSYADLSDTLYAGTYNGATGGEVWRSTTGNAGTWSQVNTDGFGTANNRAVSALAVFSDTLYASTRGNTGFGSQVWRCQVCNGSDWSKVVDNGFGNADTSGVSALEVFDDQLYFVVGNSFTGLEVWRTADGTNWTQVGFAGFGNANNRSPYWDNSVAVYNDTLYVGTSNWTDGGEVWLYLRRVYLPLTLRNY